VRLHTHLAETDDEERFCLEHFGVRPLQYVEDLGWLGDDVWLAHCVHLNEDETRRMGATGTGVAHCPTSNGRLGAGIAPVPSLLAAGAPVGLGVDGAASNECGELVDELRAAMVLARVSRGPRALTARQALEMATRHGARCLGRDDELGQLSAGAVADVALWDLDEVGYAGIEDPVAALVFGPTRPVHTLLVGGEVVVEDGELRTADPVTLAAELRRESGRMAQAAGAVSG
jgi:cytosine/adenosine deaminase-related metal-dependent hydrolase